MQLKKFFEIKPSETYYTQNSAARMTLISVALQKTNPEFNFVGFYEVDTVDNILKVAPYQSDILATPFISQGAGVCGTCWKEAKVQIENNVKLCKNYIACDDITKAEICVPVFDKSKENVVAVLDIDSTILERFNETDSEQLSKILNDFYHN